MTFHEILVVIQHTISFVGALVILTGVISALIQYLQYLFSRDASRMDSSINLIRLRLGRILVLGLEFIVAADLIGTTTTPDYYSLGILACIVAIRTVLSFTLNKEINELSKEERAQTHS